MIINRLLLIKITLIAGFVSAITGSLIAQQYLWKDSYYHLMELGFIFYLLSFYLLSKQDTKGFSKLWETIIFIILLSSVSTLVDEFFYDATKVEFNDIIRMSTITFVSIKIKYKKTLWKTL